MGRKQTEALVISLYEKGKTYRDIIKELRMSPNTIKAILSRAGLDGSILCLLEPSSFFQKGRPL
jgi:transposase